MSFREGHGLPHSALKAAIVPDYPDGAAANTGPVITTVNLAARIENRQVRIARRPLGVVFMGVKVAFGPL